MGKRRVAWVIVAAISAVLAGLQGCSRSTSVWQKHPGSPRVVVTIPALDNFVRNVGGEHVAVICLCTSQGPHHYEYTPQDAMLLREADLLFAIGLTLDDKFADRIQAESRNPRLNYVKLGERLPKKLLQANEEEHEHGKKEEGHDHEHEHGHGHEHGEHDPHVWLGIPQAIALVESIREELNKVDPKHEAEYNKNAANYVEKLKKLHGDGQSLLKNKKNRNIIAFHESLGYFAKSFDLNIVDAIEVTPGNEPPQAHLVELAKKCKDEKNPVRVIAVEPQYPMGSSAEVLKNAVKDIAFVVVDPLETADAKDLTEDGKELKTLDWYERKMRENVEALAKGLP